MLMHSNSWKVTPSHRRKIAVFFMVLLAVLVLTALATLQPMDMQTAIALNSQLNQLVQSFKANNMLILGIFRNNFTIAIISFLPFVGPLYLGYSLFGTGRAIAGEAIAHNLSPSSVFFQILQMPYTWIEFAAYSIAITSSLWLAYGIANRTIGRELKNTVEMIIVSAILLLVAAAIETAYIYA